MHSIAAFFAVGFAGKDMDNHSAYRSAGVTASETHILSVGDLTRCIRSVIEGEDLFTDVWVRGEISNLNRHSHGHIYFSLKDEQAIIRCVIWRNSTSVLAFEPSDGMRVVARGRVTVYEKQGIYQLTVTELRPDGIGALYERYEALKRSLEQEGLFAESRKKPLPSFPRRIAIVTSPTGAALRDMVSVARRRMPSVSLVLVPALVQGDGSEDSVVDALGLADSDACADVIIVGRGGGSIEDLWTFNSERVVRAIAACKTPVVSAVGHETDYTLADFVADRRAATPSAAMELVVPNRLDLQARLDALRRQMTSYLSRRLADGRARLDRVVSSVSLKYPQRIVEDRLQQLDDLQDRLVGAFRARISALEAALSQKSGRLDALSPFSVLDRGYAIVRRSADGSVIRHISDVQANEQTETLVSGGTLISQVEEVREGWD